MQINIENNVQTIEITRNGERVGDIAFSLSDPTLLSRLRTAAKKAEQIQAESKLGSTEDLDAALNKAERIDREIRNLLDWAFGAKVSAIVFGESWCFSTSGGVTAMEQFLSGVIPYIEQAFSSEVEAAQERQDKYLAKYRK